MKIYIIQILLIKQIQNFKPTCAKFRYADSSNLVGSLHKCVCRCKNSNQQAIAPKSSADMNLFANIWGAFMNSARCSTPKMHKKWRVIFDVHSCSPNQYVNLEFDYVILPENPKLFYFLIIKIYRMQKITGNFSAFKIS
jgi:hypothetical protein